MIKGKAVMKAPILKLYLIFLTAISSAPVHLILPTDDSHSWNYPLSNILPPDKLVHFALFLILGVLTIRSYSPTKKLFFVTLIYGSLMEIIQYLIPYRSFDIFDLLANLLASQFHFLYFA